MPTTDSAAPSSSTPSGSSTLRDPVEDAGLGVLVEIDQDVAAEHHVEGAEMGEILQQVELPVLDHGADIGIELPQLAGLGEMLDQHLDRQAALHLELAEDAGLGLFQHALRDVGRDNLDPPARQRRRRSPSGTSRSNTAPARWRTPRTRSARCGGCARACSSAGSIVSRR